MELRHLRYFIALAENLSFTRAAQALYISQSTLSQQISDLEDELGAQLFERSHRKVELTDAGRALLKEAREIVEQAEHLPDAVHGADGREERRALKIGFDARVLGSDFLKKAICDCLYRLRADHPGLSVDFRSSEYDTMVREVLDHTVELAFFLHQERSVKGGHVVSRCLYEDEIALVVRTPDAIEDTPEQVRQVLARRGVALLEGEGRGTLQAVRIFDDLGVEPSMHFVSDRTSLLLTVNSGERAAVLPRGIISRMVDRDATVLHLRTPRARLYVLGAWHDDADEVVHAVVSAVEDAMRPWVEVRERELARCQGAW